MKVQQQMTLLGITTHFGKQELGGRDDKNNTEIKSSTSYFHAMVLIKL